jgi:predicted AlkP superfamily phosphohydrolase/phosphomutase
MIPHLHVTLAYIGPGAGFAFLGSFLTILLSLLASAISILIWPFRTVLNWVRDRGRSQNAQIAKAIFLGMDGLDPELAEKWMAEGKLPNLSRLREQGSYRRLRTTFPALSPVAWSTFATGVNPGRHNIFDFLNRDLRTHMPELSSAKVRPPLRFVRFWRFSIPLTRPSVELRRKSEPFWKILGRNGVSSTILRVPITFPPEPFRGRLLSAMCTPDLRGTQGTFSWFTTNPGRKMCEGGVCLPLTANGSALQGSLPGPDRAGVSFTLLAGENKDQRYLEIQNQRFELRPGEYTPWIRVRFPTSSLSAVRGIVRFLLTESDPEMSLYATPVEIDPERPALPVSYPSHYAIYLAKLLGSFATLGMAEDTWALNEGAIDEAAFLKQAALVQQEREAMFFSALERTRRGVLACVFDTPDRVQHMFYRYIDPYRTESRDSPHAGTIERMYQDVDRIVGRVLPFVDRHTALFVLSDHGFSSFRRGVNLNAWLHAKGYLSLLPDLEETGDYFEGIDWSQTRAYTFGLSGIYLNLRGRESGGIVAPDEAAVLKAELRNALTGLIDDESGEIAIRTVRASEDIYSGPYVEAAPDLVIGYAPGYRAAWSAAVGKVSRHVFETNNKCWSGDHCVDPSAVPGVLFSNRKLGVEDPGIEDIAPTVLKLFGLDPPRWMEGEAFSAT